MMRAFSRWLTVAALLVVPAAAPSQVAPPPAPAASAPAPGGVPVSRLEVVARYPHDSTAFTQGLLWHDGALYESTGEGNSEVRKLSLTDGKVLARRAIPYGQFGEGMALWKSTLVSLTWKNGVAHQWSLHDFKPQGDFRYPGEGWGLTTATDGLILSDGTPTLRIVDPETFKERRRVNVTLAGRPLDKLNELEVVDGQVFANVWLTGFIVAIDPATGKVTRVIDGRALVDEIAAKDTDAVLNGIAWDAGARRLFVTGKLWPTLFEVKVVDTGEFAH